MFCFVLFCFVLFCFVLFYFVWFGLVWFGSIWLIVHFDGERREKTNEAQARGFSPQAIKQKLPVPYVFYERNGVKEREREEREGGRERGEVKNQY